MFKAIATILTLATVCAGASNATPISLRDKDAQQVVSQRRIATHPTLRQADSSTRASMVKAALQPQVKVAKTPQVKERKEPQVKEPKVPAVKTPIESTSKYDSIRDYVALERARYGRTAGNSGGKVQPVSVPEPTSLALMGLGLAGFGMFGRRKSKTAG